MSARSTIAPWLSPRLTRLCYGCALSLALLSQSSQLLAAPESPAQLSAERKLPPGRPDVILDRIDFPEDIEGRAAYVRQLREILKKEVRRVVWGAGSGSRIEYRFAITKFEVHTEKDVVRVTVSATGRLPKGKVAKSHLSFGGPLNKRSEVIRKVFEIVSRGVVTRLAEMERERRGYE